MYKLYFNNRYDENEFIVICKYDEIISHIHKFINKVNSNYKIYYTRSWKEDNRIWFDVGSHCEFFFAEEV